ncbi:hypothetical protein Vadar_030731 [Vaccinium darrowii]|uniref:Uncharacterized protein n=1 Tax=Vaccinium darrowii TaxID=229202 RepID=A0ACB7YZM3_9ERIC|nr:hypothetical protein Vadar_030731 [Vaccinium darrowii]
MKFSLQLLFTSLGLFNVNCGSVASPETMILEIRYLALDDETWYNELEVAEGMKLDRAYISPYLFNSKNQIFSEKKDRVTDALNATKAAVEEGIVPGGGVALLYASKELDLLPTGYFDQKIGVQIIQNALKTPVYKIACNAGVKGAVVVGKLLEQHDPDLGYNAAKDIVKAGIIDPLKVIRTALVDAASVSSLMTTTEAVVGSRSPIHFVRTRARFLKLCELVLAANGWIFRYSRVLILSSSRRRIKAYSEKLDRLKQTVIVGESSPGYPFSFGKVIGDFVLFHSKAANVPDDDCILNCGTGLLSVSLDNPETYLH